MLYIYMLLTITIITLNSRLSKWFEHYLVNYLATYLVNSNLRQS